MFAAEFRGIAMRTRGELLRRLVAKAIDALGDAAGANVGAGGSGGAVGSPGGSGVGAAGAAGGGSTSPSAIRRKKT